MGLESEEETERKPQLGIWSEVYCTTVFADENQRVGALLEEISRLVEEHIHLLESQKMEYQVAKNRKLIACQKF